MNVMKLGHMASKIVTSGLEPSAAILLLYVIGTGQNQYDTRKVAKALDWGIMDADRAGNILKLNGLVTSYSNHNHRLTTLPYEKLKEIFDDSSK